MTKSTTSLQPFRILAGPNRGKAQLGMLQRGNSALLSSEAPVTDVSDFPGEVLFPNLFNLYGRRYKGSDPKAKGSNDVVQVNDPEYRGNFEILPYGDPNATLIQCRYMAGHETLDYVYQVQRLGLPRHNSPEGRVYNYNTLSMGEHEVKTDNKQYYLMLKYHPMNKNSICRDDRVNSFLFQEIKPVDILQSAALDISDEFEAISYVKNAASSGRKLSILFDIIGGDRVVSYDKTDETTKYDGMLVYAKNEAKAFLDSIQNYKNNVMEAIAKAQSYNALDTTTQGAIKMKKGETKIVLVQDIPAKDNKMIDWFYENCLEPNVYEAYLILKTNEDNEFK